jgi:hypothetical protein
VKKRACVVWALCRWMFCLRTRHKCLLIRLKLTPKRIWHQRIPAGLIKLIVDCAVRGLVRCAGATAVMVVLRSGILEVGNCGDSRAVLGKNVQGQVKRGNRVPKLCKWHKVIAHPHVHSSILTHRQICVPFTLSILSYIALSPLWLLTSSFFCNFCFNYFRLDFSSLKGDGCGADV